MALINERHAKKFIELVASGEFLAVAYKQATSRHTLSKSKAEFQGHRWKKLLGKRIEEEKKKRAIAIEKARDSEAVKEALSGILSFQEVDRKLCDIINGQMKIVRDPKTGRIIRVDNGTSEKLRAIDIYYKRFGLYPVITEITSVNGQAELKAPIIMLNPAPPQADEQK